MEKTTRTFLAEMSKDERSQLNVRSISEPAAEQLAQLRGYISEIADYFSSQNVVAGLLENAGDVMRSFSELLSAYKQQPGLAEPIMEEASRQISRHFANSCSLFRSFLDHYNKYFLSAHGPESSEFIGWKKVQAIEYDAQLSYKLVYMMRNYIQHKDMPPLALQISDSIERKKFEVIISVNITEMRKDKDFDKKLTEAERDISQLSLKQIMEEWGNSLSKIIQSANGVRSKDALTACERILELRQIHNPDSASRLALVTFPMHPDPNKLDMKIEWLPEQRADQIVKQTARDKEEPKSGEIA